MAEFTPFELKLKYVKTYNPEAMYKFACDFLIEQVRAPCIKAPPAAC